MLYIIQYAWIFPVASGTHSFSVLHHGAQLNFPNDILLLLLICLCSETVMLLCLFQARHQRLIPTKKTPLEIIQIPVGSCSTYVTANSCLFDYTSKYSLSSNLKSLPYKCLSSPITIKPLIHLKTNYLILTNVD